MAVPYPLRRHAPPRPLGNLSPRQWASWVVRALLVAYIGLAILIHVVAVPRIYSMLSTPCEPGACAPGQLTPTTLGWLSERGISPSAYAALATIIPLLIPVIGHTLAAIAIWQRPTAWLPVVFVLGIALCTVNASGAIGVILMDYPAWTTFAMYALIPMHIALPLMRLYFPDGRLVPRWGVLIIAIVAADALLFLHPELLARLPAFAGRLQELWWNGSELVFAVIVAWRLHVTTDRTARRQTRIWFASQVPLWAFVAGLLLFQIDGETMLRGGGLGAVIGNLAWSLSILIFLVGFLMAIYLYNIFDLSVVLRRSIVYVVLSIALTAMYLLIVAIISTLFRGEESLAPAILATAAIAIVFAPMRARIEEGVRRQLYGDDDDPYRVLSRLGRQMEQTSIPERLLQSVVDLAQDTLRVPGVALSIPRFPGLAIAAGTLAHDGVTVPVRYQGEHVAELTVSQRTAADHFSGPDLRLLDEIARQTGIAVHTIMLSHDLRQSRERIVTAREEERRRIRRDLHDGLGPALASLSLQVEIARDLITIDPARSSVLLDDVLAQTQASLLDIRRLVYDLRPPALDDLGLVGAIRAQVATWEQGGLTVVLHLPQELPPLSAALEVAIYRIVQEALTNVVRHATATYATISLTIDDDRLHLSITDDGNGLPERYQPGVGMVSMGERAGELGGTCEISTLPGGGVCVAASFALDTLAGGRER